MRPIPQPLFLPPQSLHHLLSSTVAQSHMYRLEVLLKGLLDIFLLVFLTAIWLSLNSSDRLQRCLRHRHFLHSPVVSKRLLIRHHCRFLRCPKNSQQKFSLLHWKTFPLQPQIRIFERHLHPVAWKHLHCHPHWQRLKRSLLRVV